MNLLALFFRSYPKLVWQLRSLKHQKKFIKFNRPTNLYEYIAKSAIYYDKKWCILTDKCAVREVVKNLISDKYVNELYAVYNNTNEIIVEDLPQSFVLKTTNGCATNILVKDKQEVDWREVKARLDKWLVMPYGEMTGQPHYSEIKPRIIAEKYLKQAGKESLVDYKFFCIDGQPLLVFVYENRKINTHLFEIGVFDMNWTPLPSYLSEKIPHADDIKRPVSFDEMKNIVVKMAKEFKFVRIDLYEVNGHPIFGEYTFTPSITALSEKCKSDLFNKLKF